MVEVGASSGGCTYSDNHRDCVQRRLWQAVAHRCVATTHRQLLLRAASCELCAGWTWTDRRENRTSSPGSRCLECTWT
eukprot:COSAG06_NODE_5977_length_3173_cov_1.710150_1_plen_77_part_10